MRAEDVAEEPPRWQEPLVALYRERYAPMVRLAHLLTGNQAVAEELVQDAFVAVHRNWAKADNAPAYLRTAVVNNARSWLRRKVMENERRPQPSGPAQMAADEMWDVLQTLPERQRVAIVLRFYEDMPDDDIAKVLGCRRPTVRTAIHRGLLALRKEMEK